VAYSSSFNLRSRFRVSVCCHPRITHAQMIVRTNIVVLHASSHKRHTAYAGSPKCTVEACWAWTQVNALPLPDVRARQTSQRFVRLYASPPCDRPNKSSKSLLPNAVPARAPCACAIGDMAQHRRAAPSQARRRDVVSSCGHRSRRPGPRLQPTQGCGSHGSDLRALITTGSASPTEVHS